VLHDQQLRARMCGVDHARNCVITTCICACSNINAELKSRLLCCVDGTQVSASWIYARAYAWACTYALDYS
jgi:hypothetical protein